MSIFCGRLHDVLHYPLTRASYTTASLFTSSKTSIFLWFLSETSLCSLFVGTNLCAKGTPMEQSCLLQCMNHFIPPYSLLILPIVTRRIRDFHSLDLFCLLLNSLFAIQGAHTAYTHSRQKTFIILF